MAAEFSFFYYVLIGLVALESLIITRVLRGTATIAKELREHKMATVAEQGGPAKGTPIPKFSAKLWRSGAKISDEELLGETSSLIFVETSDDRSSSLRLSEEVIRTLRRTIKGTVIVACCGGGCGSLEEQSSSGGPLLNVRFVDDDEYSLASRFNIRGFPTAVSLNEFKEVIGVGRFSFRSQPSRLGAVADRPQFGASEAE